jgi:hypothetical protein
VVEEAADSSAGNVTSFGSVVEGVPRSKAPPSFAANDEELDVVGLSSSLPTAIQFRAGATTTIGNVKQFGKEPESTIHECCLVKNSACSNS